MNLSFTDDQIALREVARSTFERYSTHERLKEIDTGEDRFDSALWTELARANVLGAGIDEQYGGIGGGFLEMGIVLEELGRSSSRVPLLQAMMVARALAESGHGALLSQLMSGAEIVTTVLARDALHLSDGRISGRLSGVGYANVASKVLVPVGGGEAGRLCLVDLSVADVTPQPATGGGPSFAVSFHDAPAETIAGSPDAFEQYATAALCALQLGVAERALDLTAAYLKEREQFGKPLGAFQAVQQRAADSYIDVQAMRWTAWQAIWRLAEGWPAAEEVAIAKYWASEGGHRVLSAAQHLHGGMGVDLEYPLHRYTLLGKEIELTLGGATEQLARLGDLMAEAR